MRTTCFHTYIINKLRFNCDNMEGIMKRKDVKDIFIRSHIPLKIHKKFLKELESMGHIKSKDKLNIILVNFE